MHKYKTLFLILALAAPAFSQVNTGGIPAQQLDKNAAIRNFDSFANVDASDGLRDGERITFDDAEGLFFYDDDSSATVNGTSSGPGTVMNGPGSVGRIIRIGEGPAKPEWWGADPTASAAVNASAIQAAVDAVPSTGGRVVLQGGTYDVSVSITIGNDKVTLAGQGMGASVLKIPDGMQQFNVLVCPHEQCVFRDFSIDMNRANTTAAASGIQGILYNNTSAIDRSGNLCERVSITGSHHRGVSSLGNAAVMLREHTYRGCVVTDCGLQGISVANGVGYRIESCKVDDCEINIQALRADSCVISDTISTNSGTHGFNMLYCDAATVTGCVANDNHNYGIIFGGGDNTQPVSTNFVITGNTLLRNGDGGISIDPSWASDAAAAHDTWATVTANTIDGAITAGRNCIFITHIRYATIANNVCRNATASGVLVGNSHKVNVSGNALTENGHYGISFSGTAVADAGEHACFGNVFSGNASGTVNYGNTSAIQEALIFKKADATDGDTTPSVAGVRTLVLDNSASTSIADFDDGVDGQEIVVIVRDANTSITDSTDIEMQGTSYTAAAGNQCFYFVLDGTQWQLISRTDQ